MLFVAPLLLASTLSLAGVQDPVYLATFDNEQQEIKTRISFHHALLSDERNGILLQLSNQDVLRLQSKGIKLTPADALWRSKVKKMQSFLDWFKELRSIHIITNEEFLNILNKM